MLLEHVKNINFTDEELDAEYASVLESFNSTMIQLDEAMGMPQPGMADADVRQQEFPVEDEISSSLENAVKQMVAVKKAMTILNKMPDSESRTRNKSRVMGNLNRIRGSLQRIVKMMDNQGMEK